MDTGNPTGRDPSPAPAAFARAGRPVQDVLREETRRARWRRQLLGVRRPGDPADQWALALSGGGIRSATFCLGVLQGLARSPGPDPAGPGPGGDPAPGVPLPGQSMLDQFDYVSTVSGGGYIGAFLSSLYVPGRLTGEGPGADPVATARRVADVLREEPPGRLGRDTVFDAARPGRAALAWLRDNGRYLAPAGAGDFIYAMAMALRNWLATQYVVGTAIGAGMALVVLLHWLLLWTGVYGPEPIRGWLDWVEVWRSPLWLLAVPVVALWTAPTGVAYWFTHMSRGASAWGCGLAIAVVLLVFGLRAWPADGWRWIARLSLLGGAVALFGLLFHVVALDGRLRELRTGGAGVVTPVTLRRVRLTRWFGRSLTVLLGILALALVDTAALALQRVRHDWSELALSASVTGALVWGVQQVAQALGDRQQSRAWLARLPQNALLLAGGVLVWGLVAVAWESLVLAAVLNGAGIPADVDLSGLLAVQCQRAATVCVLLTVLAVTVGRFPGFLNLSTLQGLYAARLTRAYLGASNHGRFSGKAPGHRRRLSAAEPVDGDGLDLADIRLNPAAPMHLINVCLNETADPGEQLVQRDRKGRPLVVVPDGFQLDGQFWRFARDDGSSEVTDPPSLGEWIAVSGAALTTGLGRATSLGGSLLLGFANVRLGRWWPSGVRRDGQDGREAWPRRLLRTQVYLFDEITARFFGTRRAYQYLSDGGHFENTAVYELLRPGRRVRLIVVCDCGCDPQYQHGDLANLMRLARIDHGLELRVDEQVADHPLLGRVFGRLEGAGESGAARAASLVGVFAPGQPPDAPPLARLIVLKPTLLEELPLDVAHYRNEHAAFPQESTGDQFFDEAQWESYRQLGLQTAQRVFPQGGDEAYREAFWKHVGA